MSLSLLKAYESDSSQEEATVHALESAEAPKKRESLSNHSSPAAAKTASSQPNAETECKKKQSTNKSHQRESKTPSDIPPDLVRELKAAGHNVSDIDILDIGPAPIANQPHPSSYIPQHALRNNAMRLARHITKESVSSVARRKHQITALAAEAVALQVAQDTLPGTARPGSRMNGKFK